MSAGMILTNWNETKVVAILENDKLKRKNRHDFLGIHNICIVRSYEKYIYI